MAEAIVNTSSEKHHFQAFSAGWYPKSKIHPMAVEAAARLGIDISMKKPKPISVYQNDYFNFIIILSHRMEENFPPFPGNPLYFYWTTPESFSIEDKDSFSYFLALQNELSCRIQLLLSLGMDKLTRMELKHKLEETASEDFFPFAPWKDNLILSSEEAFLLSRYSCG
ncbi:MAG TPA: hypothetical protein DHW82_13230 [Spirochaetia bacterium]|nr:hypothetical protein [Spirochaetia bacterium]